MPGIPEQDFDVEALKERLRAEVCRKESLFGSGVATNSVPGAALEYEKPYSEALQFNLTGKVEAQIAKLPALIEEARGKTEVSRWVPKVFRRLFRKQGRFNKILLDSLKVLVKTQRGLSAENRALREYLEAQYYWLRDHARSRADDRAWISALNARCVMHEQTSYQLQTQIDRQGDRVSELVNFISAILANVDLQIGRADDLDRQVQVAAAHAVEFEKRLDLETQSRSAVIAELDARIEEERQCRGSSIAELRAAKVSAQNAELDHRYDAFYLAFENRFRGRRSEIKSRFQVYLPRLGQLKVSKKSMRIVDLGCGRGEWLELLEENHYDQIRGVDANIAMAAYCRKRGLEVIVEDCVDYLGGLKKGSLHVISSFHVIEHLPFDRLMRLLTECHRVLKRGGLLILETPNPDNLIVAAKNFYTDPTHQRPLPSLLMSFLSEHVGFSKVEIVNQHPFKPDVFVHEKGDLALRFNQLFYGEQDYAVIARKK